MVCYKSKPTLTIQSSNPYFMNLPNCNEKQKQKQQQKLFPQTYVDSTATAFIPVHIRKQTKYPTTNKKINKWCSVNAIKYYSTIMNTLTNLRPIILSERNQTQKITYYTVPCKWHSGKAETIRAENGSDIVYENWMNT